MDGKKLRKCKQDKLTTKMKYVNGKFDDCSVSPKIRQIWLYLIVCYFFVHIKKSYYYSTDKNNCKEQKVIIMR